MRSKKIFFFFLFLLLFFLLLLMIPSLSWCASQKTKVSRSIKAELSLANSSDLYMILDLRARKIDLKAKGIVLRTWKIEKIRLWGDPVQSNPVTLVKKTALFPPKREDIKPGEQEEKATFKLEALELNDMPSSYTLRLEQNISMYVGPQSKKWISFLRNTGHALRWFFYLPLRTVWTTVAKKAFTAFEITLENKEESQAFYWALGENSPFIILPP